MSRDVKYIGMDVHNAGNGSGPRIFLRRLAHDEPSGSTQAAAKPVRGCSLAASEFRFYRCRLASRVNSSGAVRPENEHWPFVISGAHF